MTDYLRLRTATLGCKVNQYETELVREGLMTSGFRNARADEEADLCVVNTCTVTAEGDAKSRQVIRRLARENPRARIIVMGCYATRAPEEVAQLPRVVEVVTDKREIPDLLGRLGVIDPPQGISRFGDRHRAYVKVQDGCLLRCTYCIIPYVRPRMSSRPVGHIVDEVWRLVDQEYREIVLTGIHLGHYGVDFNRGRPRSEWVRLSGLLTRLTAIPGEFRIRLSSIEATELSRELIDVLCLNPERICPHLHVCLQSGSDRILRRMHRRWGIKRFIDRCHMVRELLEQPALTTDVIVGFPGETDADFEATCAAVRACGFMKIHIFPYSRRRGTPAAEYPNQISPAVQRARSQVLAQVESELRLQYMDQLRGRCLEVLLEAQTQGSEPGWWGTACRYFPVHMRLDPRWHSGQLVRVQAGDPFEAGVRGLPVELDPLPSPC